MFYLAITFMIDQILDTTEVIVTPVNQISQLLYENGRHALLGISPFNGYFTEARLTHLFEWALEHFQDFNVFLPDGLSVFTLRAIGYSKERANYKTKRQDTYLRNKVIRSLYNLGVPNPTEKIITRSQLVYNPIYQKIYTNCMHRFHADDSFRNGCLSTSSWIVSKYKNRINTLQGLNSDDGRNEVATEYFLAEFPLFLNTPAILNVPSSIFVYHSVPTYLRTVYNLKGMVAKNQGFLEVSVAGAKAQT